jgi:hypothetical protein
MHVDAADARGKPDRWQRHTGAFHQGAVMKRIICAALALLLSFQATAKSGGPPVQPVPWSSLGANWISVIPTFPFRFCRIWDQAEWSSIETASGVYSWTGLDAVVAQMQTQGCVISYTFGSVPGWANGNASRDTPPTNFSDFYAFVSAVATRYHGKIKYYTPWNEPNTPGDWWSGTVAQMVTLTENVATTIHGIDTGALVMSPSATNEAGGAIDGASYADQLFAAGIGSFVDGVDAHIYRKYVTNGGATPPEQIWQSLQQYQGLRANYSLQGKPFIVTEGDWGNNTSTVLTAAQQGEWAISWPFFMASSGVTGFAWYQYDNPFGWSPLYASGALTVGGQAYTTASSELSGATLAPLLARTPNANQIRNPSASGAVVGTPGTLPTDWTLFNPDSTHGVSTQIVGSGVENGIPYVDFRVFGTPTTGAGGQGFVAFESKSQIAAVNNQQWTAAAFVKLQAGSTSNVTVSINYNDYDSGPGYLSTPLFLPFTPTAWPLQYDLQSWPSPTQDATIASVQPFIQFAYTVGQAFDITLRIGQPSMDTGSIWSSSFAKASGFQGELIFDASGGPTSWTAPAWCSWATNYTGTKTAVSGALSLTYAPVFCSNQ